MAGTCQSVLFLVILLEPPELDLETHSACAESHGDSVTGLFFNLSYPLAGILSFLVLLFSKDGLQPWCTEPGEVQTAVEDRQKKKKKKKKGELDCSEQ